MVSPRRYRAMVERVISTTVWSATLLMAEIAARWIEDGTFGRTVEREREEATARVRMAKRISAGYWGKGHRCGLAVWLELPVGWTSEEFMARA